jgi:hypothetical protein
MSTEIKCPNCAHSFPIEEVMAEEYKKDLREKMLSFTKQKDDEYNKKLNEFSSQQKQQEQLFAQQQQARELEYQKKLTAEKKQLQTELEESLRKRIATDFETKLQLLDHTNKENDSAVNWSSRSESRNWRKTTSKRPSINCASRNWKSSWMIRRSLPKR